MWSRLEVWQQRLLRISVDEFSGWEMHFDNKVTVRLGVKNLMQRLDLYLKVAKHWSLLDAVEGQVLICVVIIPLVTRRLVMSMDRQNRCVDN